MLDILDSKFDKTVEEVYAIFALESYNFTMGSADMTWTNTMPF